MKLSYVPIVLIVLGFVIALIGLWANLIGLAEYVQLFIIGLVFIGAGVVLYILLDIIRILQRK